ncbi:MAG TPA: AI-2E family transporter YdiK [Vicinamibacterales bacterium]|nr:AI-2E family transporter YdiK [Vicinamibacterales bacterium]
MRSEESGDITRVVLFVLVIGALLLGSFWTLLPFLSGLIWATTIAIATWPLLLSVQRVTAGRRAPAVAIMTLLVLMAFILPFAIAVSTLIDAAERSPTVMSDFLSKGVGPPPEWVARIPAIGDQLAERWQTVSAGGPQALAEIVQPYARGAATWALAATGGFGRTLVLILLTVLLVTIFYAQGETAASGALAFARRLGGETGERTLRLAGQAVRSVALGVVLTALVQSVLAGIGLWLCGIPHPGVLTAIAFVFGIAQVGPAPVLLPAIAWLYWTGSTGWATVLLVWSVPVLTLDNILRPILIRRGVQLPLLLIIAGVIGGLISFGVVGLFVGPVVLAATYTLAKDWVARGTPDGSSRIEGLEAHHEQRA